MKKLLIIIAIIGLAAIALFVKDPSEAQKVALTSIYDTIIVKNSDNAVAACQNMVEQVNAASPGQRPETLNDAFKKLVMAWAAVRTTYIAGELDAAAIDYPQRFIDTFHLGKTDLDKQMQRIVRADTPATTALYTNPSKTINALDIVLYQDDTINQRKLALAKVIVPHICNGLGKIQQTYQNHRDDFINEPSKALSLLANALASETFKTKDWRIGDPAGLTKKYLNNPNPNRAELPYSGLGLSVIEAVFATQDQLIGEHDYPNFRELAAFYDAQQQLSASQQLLSQAQNAAAELNQPDFSFDPNATVTLYNTTNELQTSYYSNLIQALPVMAKILEADGD